jgi:hypothetical protein
MTATNKRYSYPRVTVIQIDIHHAGENPTNTPHTFHAQSAYGPRPYVSSASAHIATFCESPIELNRVTALEKQGS